MKYKIGFLIPILLLICLFCNSGCEGDIATIDEDEYGALDTAAIAVSVQWPDEAGAVEDCDATGVVNKGDAHGARMSASPITLSDNCTSRGVDKVHVDVQNNSGATLKSATFDCSAGRGTLTGVKPQSGCRIILSGLNPAGTAIYRGNKTDVTLHAGMNDVGTIWVESLNTSQYTVTATAGTGGSVTPSSRSVSSGSTASFTVSANSDFTLNTATGGTCPAGSWSGNIYTTGSISGNCSVSFSFSQAAVLKYSVTATAGTGGSVTPSSQSVSSGSKASFTVIVNSDYTLNYARSGTCPAGSWSGSMYKTGAISGNCSVSFRFIQKKTDSSDMVVFKIMNMDAVDQGFDPLLAVNLKSFRFQLNGLVYDLAYRVGDDDIQGAQIKTYSQLVSRLNDALGQLIADEPLGHEGLRGLTISLGSYFFVRHPETQSLLTGTDIVLHDPTGRYYLDAAEDWVKISPATEPPVIYGIEVRSSNLSARTTSERAWQ